MRILKLLLLVVLVGGVSTAGYMFWMKRKSPQLSSMSPQSSSPSVLGVQSLPHFSALDSVKNLPKNINVGSLDLQDLSDKAKTEIQGVQEKATEMQKHIGVVLGTTKEDGSPEDGEPVDANAIRERALDYGQYLYCKGVVDEWEKK